MGGIYLSQKQTAGPRGAPRAAFNLNKKAVIL